MEEGRERERSRVRAPSPPSSGRYEYEEVREKSSRKVVDVEPRYGGGVEQYQVPGAFEDEDEGYGKGRGKEYYQDAGYGRGGRGGRDEEARYSASGRGGRERKDSYERVSPREEKKYYADDGYGRGQDEYGRDKREREKESLAYGGEGYKYDSREREREKESRRKEAELEEYRLQKKAAEEKEYRDREERERRDREVRAYEEEKKAREARDRSASFNVSTGHGSFSGGVGFHHDNGHGQPQGQYPPPPASVAGYQIPPAGYPGHVGPPPVGFQGVYPPPAGYPGPGGPPAGYSGPPPPNSEPVRHPSLPAYAEPKQWEYAQPNENITYSQRTESYSSVRPASPPKTTATYASSSSSRSRHGSKSYVSEPPRASTSSLSASNVVTVEPGSRNRRERDKSPAPGLTGRMHSLSVSTGHHGSATMSLANAPGSPLLESYHGTYQSISPMPSPLMIAQTAHTDMPHIESISPYSSDSDDGGHRGKPRRTARFHDPAEEATILAKALKGDKHGPDTDPLIEILPGLTHEQILELRVEYKKIVKTGSEKKGVNIAKHIKLRLKEEDPSLMKACYAVALGKWESEAYWANFWYQGEKSRRELLIESLMGRTNREIQMIKDGFSDKKYSDSLTKCMKMELKEDKFKKAVLLVLEGKKTEEKGGYIDRDLVEDDVRDLYKAVRSDKGGESSMIGIICVRSDSHLREVLRVYEASYRANFAREMLKKSGNLVVSP